MLFAVLPVAVVVVAVVQLVAHAALLMVLPVAVVVVAVVQLVALTALLVVLRAWCCRCRDRAPATRRGSRPSMALSPSATSL